MNPNLNLSMRRTTRGQTLVVAIMILAVLLVLGFVFLGILNRNINQAGRSQNRSVGNDLGKAGVEYAHNQMQHSELRADWRPSTVRLATAGDFTRDPDALYLRGASGYPLRIAGDTLVDRGGPDGLGPYGRVLYSDGRALVRVRWAPSDANLFDTNPVGALREPGKARNYLIIESIGRPGRINPDDPTQQLNSGGVKFQNYADEAEFRNWFSQMKERDAQFQSSRRLIAFASIGLTEHALFITNRDGSSRPAQLGFPIESGARYGVGAVQPTLQFGNFTDGPAAATVSGGGSIWSNTDLTFFGNTSLILNQGLGDGLWVAGKIKASDGAARLFIRRTRGDDSVVADDDNIELGETVGIVNGGNTTDRLNSDDPFFGTIDGLIRDGIQASDPVGHPRFVGAKQAPSITDINPATGANTYFTETRNSGRIVADRNTGRLGHGEGVYVNNLDDRQMRVDEDGRQDSGSAESLVYDWLNPNNGQAGTGWQGPFYVPVGAYVRLTWDGFTITRDGRAPAARRTWRNLDGSDSGLTTIRYRIGDPDGPGPLPNYIINTITNPADIAAANPVWTNGFPFNGLVYFEGNVRVRGTIPTDVQMTFISNATIYIEGSITKGVITDNAGSRLTRPSRSALMLMAKDYVTLNTTQFFGTGGNQPLDEVNEGLEGANPVRINSGFSLGLATDLMWRSETVAGLPGVTASNPSTWRPFARDYIDPGTNNPINSSLLVSHATDGDTGFSVLGMTVNFGIGTWTYNFFDRANSFPPNVPSFGPRKALGIENWGRSALYETIGLPVIDPTTATWTGSTVTSTAPFGAYTMLLNGANDFTIQVLNDMPSFAPGQNYKVRRAVMVPHDVKIEASVYAQDGAFFVIPGQWFNPNPNDRRDTYAALGATPAECAAERLARYGSHPETPFYGEPLDVRVQIIGSVSMNMPVPISQQSEWLKKWGWIPREQGATGQLIPSAHVPPGYNITGGGGDQYVPNLTITYDPMLATGRTSGYRDLPDSYVRYLRLQPDPVNNPAFQVDYPLAPMPRLPVSPTLIYYGEVIRS